MPVLVYVTCMQSVMVGVSRENMAYSKEGE